MSETRLKPRNLRSPDIPRDTQGKDDLEQFESFAHNHYALKPLLSRQQQACNNRRRSQSHKYVGQIQ